MSQTSTATDRAHARSAIIEAAIERARRYADEGLRTISCDAVWHRAAIAQGQVQPHPTCLGRAAVIRPEHGCLCECHDA